MKRKIKSRQGHHLLSKLTPIPEPWRCRAVGGTRNHHDTSLSPPPTTVSWAQPPTPNTAEILRPAGPSRKFGGISSWLWWLLLLKVRREVDTAALRASGDPAWSLGRNLDSGFQLPLVVITAFLCCYINKQKV